MPLDGHLPDISPAPSWWTPQMFPKRTILYRGASNLHSRQFNAEEFSWTYVCTMPRSALRVKCFKFQLNVTPISVCRRDATPGIIRKKHLHRDQSSLAISKTKSIRRWQITEFHPRLTKWVYTWEVRRVGKQFNSHSNVYQHSPAAPFNKPNFGHRLALAVCAWIDWPLWGRPGPTPHY